MKRFLILLFLIPQLLLGQSGLVATNWVNDYVNILTDSQETQINSKISNFEKQTDIEISFALVDTLNGKDIESFSNELFKIWGVGKANRNNGLLVVIAPNERKWRIETGYGLESYLSDGQAYSFGNSNFKPNFKQGNYYKGIDDFLTQVTSHLGTSSWEDRVAYTQRVEQERKEAWSNFWWTTLYVVLSIICLIIFVVLFIRFKKKVEEQKKFLAEKNRKANLYTQEVDSINSNLKRFNLDPIIANSDLILSSKNKIELDSNYRSSLNSLSKSKELCSLVSNLYSKTSELERVYSHVSSKEKELNLPVSSKTNIVWNPKADSVSLNKNLANVNRELSLLNSRMDTINEFVRYTSIGFMNSDIVDSKVDRLLKRFESEPYKLSDINKYSDSLKSSYQGFNQVEKTFDNLSKIKSAYKMIESSEASLNNYVDSVDRMNRNHHSMVSTLKNSTSALQGQNLRLSKYLTQSDVSSSTKTAIKSFLLTLLAFKVTSSLIDSYNSYNSLVDQCEKLARKAQSDVDAEELKRRRKREEEERARRRREEEEEEDRRRRNSYYSSSSSWSSSSSNDSSSWGGFGGGDSGGGGASGDW